jgi:hypothetical protein
MPVLVVRRDAVGHILEVTYEVSRNVTSDHMWHIIIDLCSAQ